MKTTFFIVILDYSTATVHTMTIKCKADAQNEEIEDILIKVGYRLGNCNWMSSKKPIEIIEHGYVW
ncbi:MAG: hypothetical protein WC123_05060 [Bacilli bacterium]